ncbi:MAG: hypothetical protein QM820_15875 [Minicystis sp.]
MRAFDLALRFAFFAVVPFLATYVSVLFPMAPVLANMAFTLIVFAAAEAVRERVHRSPLLAKLLKRRLDFVAHYREHPPKPFLFYVLYPLLLPYVLARRDERRELGLYRGLTGGGVLILFAGAGVDFAWHWQPQLDLKAFAPRWIVLFAIQTLGIFLFLMPVATTVVELHIEKRFRVLWLLLGIAAVSASGAVVRLALRHRHNVSWVTTQRLRLRTDAAPEAAKTAQLKALRAAWDNFAELRASTDEGGWVEGDALDRAEEHLGVFYKPDEAYAFSMHAYPPSAPEVLVLQCHLGRGNPPIWRALKRSGQEVTSPADLPRGVLDQERRATRRPPTMRATRSRIEGIDVKKAVDVKK